jgi:hypothetical protein
MWQEQVRTSSSGAAGSSDEDAAAAGPDRPIGRPSGPPPSASGGGGNGRPAAVPVLVGGSASADRPDRPSGPPESPGRHRGEHAAAAAGRTVFSSRSGRSESAGVRRAGEPNGGPVSGAGDVWEAAAFAGGARPDGPGRAKRAAAAAAAVEPAVRGKKKDGSVGVVVGGGGSVSGGSQVMRERAWAARPEPCRVRQHCSRQLMHRGVAVPTRPS